MFSPNENMMRASGPHNAAMPKAHQVVHGQPGSGDIVIADHVHSGHVDVIPGHRDGGDLLGDLPQYRRGKAVRDEDEALDLELLESVDFCSLERGVISTANEHRGETVLAHFCLNAVQDFGEDGVVQIENENAECSTFLDRETSRCSVRAISQLIGGTKNSFPTLLADLR